MQRVHDIREWALDHAETVLKSCAGRNPSLNEVHAVKMFSAIAESMCECEEHHHDMLDDGHTFDGERYIRKGHHGNPTKGGAAMNAVATATPYCIPHEGWGDADPQARKLFEALEHHFMGYWKGVAAFNKTRSAEEKQRMLDHFKGLLLAHDRMAAFVKGSCPAACPEIMEALQQWMATKKGA